MILWLDDLRNPEKFGFVGAVWVKNYDEAITALKTGKVTFASLDHDLDLKMTNGELPLEKTGYDVICFMEENNIWPVNGVRVHSSNPSGGNRMRQVIYKYYGRNFY
jgi:hypothetical protein